MRRLPIPTRCGQVRRVAEPGYANRSDARVRLAEMIAAAHIAPRKRKATRPSKAAKAKRVENKRQRSGVKQARGKVTDF